MTHKGPQIGEKVPTFKGETSAGPLSSSDLKGQKFVLYFYPKDDTPGCTIEACAFRDNLPQFTKLNIKVFGVSRDPLASHEKFSEKYELPFTLISDTDGTLCEAFGVWGERSLYGRKFMGIERATFLINEQGKILHAWRNVKSKGHVDAILEKLKS